MYDLDARFIIVISGRELFGKDYWEQCLQDALPYQLSPADILATLTELTVASIAHSYHSFLSHKKF